MTQFFTARDGARLAFQVEGAGTPLLCLPGLTRTMGDFDYLRPHLPPIRLIRMDYRGRGASEWTGPASYSIAQEAQDVLALLDHLGLGQVAVLGSSRGGLIGLVLAATAKERLSGLLLNDVGPDIEKAGLDRIFDYLGRNPAAKTHEEMAARLAKSLTGFTGVPAARWLDEARLHYRSGTRGLEITYDPSLREPFVAAFSGSPVDLWPLFDACAGLPLGLIRGANSDLLSAATAEAMRRRRPDMIFAEVPGRGHLPFLDEPESLAAVRAFLAAVA
jgi:pimeloyl-ACP methyl ester carboxylesterase